MNKTVEKIPTWSLPYLINGDSTGLETDEINFIDKWVKDWGVEIVSPLTDENNNYIDSYFSSYPLFGLPCEVVDCDILYTRNI